MVNSGRRGPSQSGFRRRVPVRTTVTPKMILIGIIGLNALRVAASLGILVSGMVSPNGPGYAFVIARALAVGLISQALSTVP